jgi:hypothetical protein
MSHCNVHDLEEINGGNDLTDQLVSDRGPGPDAVWRDKLAAGDFDIQHCTGCGKHIFYPRALCHYCGSTDLEWVRASGQATVYATSVVRVRPDHGSDYNIALVDLAEGPRMMTRVVDIEPVQVKIGMRVTAFIGDVDGELALLFRPVPGGNG